MLGAILQILPPLAPLIFSDFILCMTALDYVSIMLWLGESSLFVLRNRFVDFYK